MREPLEANADASGAEGVTLADDDDLERHLEGAILELLARRSPTASICPSEAARQVRPLDWRGLMEATRDAARRLVQRGEVEITQAGRVVDPAALRGPIRIRRVWSTPPRDVVDAP